MQIETTVPINKPQSVFCGQCGCVLVEMMPCYNGGKTSVDKYYCLNCKTCPSTITYIYK